MERNLALNLVEKASRLSHHWLTGGDSREFSRITTKLCDELTKLKTTKKPNKILIYEQDSVKFLASFVAACDANIPVFIGNPTWEKQERQQVMDLVQPGLILKELAIIETEAIASTELYQNKYELPKINSPLIMIPTGGSSGKIKFVIHTWETLNASVQGFKEYFQVSQINSFCVLPTYHVSGLMQFIRSFTTSGQLAILPFKAIEAGEKGAIAPEEFFISLVPTQLQRLLKNPEMTHWLSQFHTVLLGGAPAWPELLEAARYHQIRLAPTYGMTETASQIATLKPDDFLAGNNSSGQVLPHASIAIRSSEGEILGYNQTGIITIAADSLGLGYYPELFKNRSFFQGDDLGFLDENNYLNIVGRNSDKIITGGENVFPAEVEAAILATGLVSDICILGLPDRHWGQVVTAIYIPSYSEVSSVSLQAAIQDKLSKVKQPKYWVIVDIFLRNEQGKVRRDRLEEMAIKKLKENGAIADI